MTQDEACSWLLVHGAKEYDDHSHSSDVRCFQMPRMTDVPSCGLNEKPPSLHVVVFPDIRPHYHGGVEFEVAGQAGDGRWLAAKIYCCRRDEMADVLVDAEYVAKELWTTYSELMNMRRPPRSRSHDQV